VQPAFPELGELAMAEYQIVCVERVNGHITHVGLKGLPGIWTVAQVRGSIGRGNAFYTVSPSTRAVAGVEPYDLVQLSQKLETIRSAPEAIDDNNLDRLRVCKLR
jgi:hypothetical protein